jgi:hypothetical protein
VCECVCVCVCDVCVCVCACVRVGVCVCVWIAPLLTRKLNIRNKNIEKMDLLVKHVQVNIRILCVLFQYLLIVSIHDQSTSLFKDEFYIIISKCYGTVFFAELF